jgi:OHCU decarboxylase
MACTLRSLTPPAPIVPVPLAALHALGESQFVDHLGTVVEHSPWVARRAWADAPFASFEALYEAMARSIHGATPSQQLTLLRTHPELAGREAVAGTMTADSNAEQARLGLMALSPQTLARLTALNQAYQARFGYPFIVALRLHESLASVLQAGEARLRHDPDTEWPLALQQVCEVMRGRLARVVQDSATPAALFPPSPVSTASRTLP